MGRHTSHRSGRIQCSSNSADQQREASGTSTKKSGLEEDGARKPSSDVGQDDDVGPFTARSPRLPEAPQNSAGTILRHEREPALGRGHQGNQPPKDRGRF